MIPKRFAELREIPWKRSIRQRSLGCKVITRLSKSGREWAYSRREVEEFAEFLKRAKT
jgi:hypothetical protein